MPRGALRQMYIWLTYRPARATRTASTISGALSTGKDDGHHRHRARETAEPAGRHRVNAYRQTPPGEQRQRAQHPRDGQRVARSSHGHRDTGEAECSTVRGQQPRDEFASSTSSVTSPARTMEIGRD